MPAAWADSGAPQNPDPGLMEWTRVRRPSGGPAAPAGVLPRGFPGVRGWGVRWSSQPPSVGARVCACVCAVAPGRVPRGSRRPWPARAPVHVASMWSSLTSLCTAVVATGRVAVWTGGRVPLAAAFRPLEVGARPVGHVPSPLGKAPCSPEERGRVSVLSVNFSDPVLF